MQRRRYRQLARRSGQGVEKLLGTLESEIMEEIWVEPQPVTVRDMLTRLNEGREPALAYTTVMTIMARLTEKGLLTRTLVNNTHEYRAAQDRDEFLRRSSERIVEELMADFGEVAIASFVEAIERVAPERLQALRRYLQPEGGDR
jgi:predicted transcriptional regulator